MKLKPQITYFGGWSTASKEAESPTRGGGGAGGPHFFPSDFFKLGKNELPCRISPSCVAWKCLKSVCVGWVVVGGLTVNLVLALVQNYSLGFGLGPS